MAIIPKHFRQCGSCSNIVTKFEVDPLKNIWVAERTRLILTILANPRAITPKCFMGSGWLLTLAKRFCQQKYQKVWWWSIEKNSSNRADKVYFGKFKGHNSKALHGIRLDISLGRDILPTNIFTKFDDYTMKTIEVIERTNALDAARRTCSHNTSHFFQTGV